MKRGPGPENSDSWEPDSDEPMPTRHLHMTDLMAYCGLDISHVLATFEPDEATCQECLANHERRMKLRSEGVY